MEINADVPHAESRAVAERVAFDHLVMIRFHLEALVEAVDSATKLPFSPRSIIDLRHAFVDVRMIIEELMLLAVSAHEDAGEVISRSLRRAYQADKKMARLRALNPRFYPDAIDVVPTEDTEVTGQFVSVDDEYLSEQEARDFYTQCGDKLHATCKQVSRTTYEVDIEQLRRFIQLTSRLLRTFEIDISGQGYILLGHLNLGASEPPALFVARMK